LANEAADSLRQAAKKQGFNEREVFHADTSSFKWEDVLQSLNSLSLFAEKKLVEIRCAKKHLNDKQFLEYWQNSNPDCVTLIITEKLDKTTLNTKWFSALEKNACIVQIWPLDAQQLTRWLQQRAKQQKLNIEPQAIQILQERVEGNLLAAAQELEKLALLYNNQTITAEMLHNAVADNARYDVFGLIDHCLQGNSSRALTILQFLLEEGSSEFLILRSLTREIRTLCICKEAIEGGQSANAALQKNGVWPQRQSFYLDALKRLSFIKCNKLLIDAQQLDLAVMGLVQKNVSNSLQNLCLGLAGK